LSEAKIVEAFAGPAAEASRNPRQEQGYYAPDGFFAWAWDSFTQNAPSIPPNREKLWEAFYEAMDVKYKSDQRKDGGLDLGDPSTNEFTIHFCKDTDNDIFA
jgi:hypothetical protein